ncbi:MAG TPA: tetratricopeptide repeat protein [Gemmatimonadaceae bacterium]|nr:tetratricopeptide repeat protein [Gemmatimonadaceae bacterium]
MKALTREAKIALYGLVAASAVWVPSSLSAQRGTAPPEGTPRLMVTPFRGNEKGLGSEASEAVLDKITDDVPLKTLFVIPKKYVCQQLEASGFSCDSTPDPITSKLLATALRADEYLEGTVTKTPNGYKLETRMVLTRDNSMVQPLPTVEGRKIKDLAEKVSDELQAARKQLPAERSCELAIRDGKLQDAAAAAKQAIAAYPNSTIGRVCLANAYLAMKQPPDSIIAVTSKAIELDPKLKPALALAADAYKAKFDATKDSTALDKAVDTWAAMLAADPKNTRLVLDVSQKIAASGRAERAKPIIVKAVEENPGDPSLIRLKWLILSATKDYAEAAAAGEQMVKVDTSAADTSFFIRQAALYASAEQPQKAAETTARGVAKFKNNADLWALNSQTQRLAGQSQAAVEAANTAIKLDPKAEHVYLRKAQAELDLKQPDSALATLRAGLAAGQDSTTLGQFILALGSQAYKAASDTTHPPKIEDFQRAVSILALADSVAPSEQAKFVMGVSAFRIGDLAVRQNQKEKSCDLAKLAQESFLTAQVNIAAGGKVDPQTAQTLLGGLQQYTPAVESQVKTFCK